MIKIIGICFLAAGIIFFAGCMQKENSSVLSDPEDHPLEVLALSLAMMQGYVDYTTSRRISASSTTIFSVITDYEKYPVYFPDLHDSVEIISKVKNGKGVVWKSTGTFKGVTFTTIWEVTEYISDRKVVMKDTEGEGTVTLTITQCSLTSCTYTYDAHIFMFLPYKDEFFAIFEKEADSVKHYSEI